MKLKTRCSPELVINGFMASWQEREHKPFYNSNGRPVKMRGIFVEVMGDECAILLCRNCSCLYIHKGPIPPPPLGDVLPE